MPSHKTQASKATKTFVEDYLNCLSPANLQRLPGTGNFSVFKPELFKVGTIYQLSKDDYHCKFTIKWVFNFTRHVLMEFPDGSKKEFKRLCNRTLDHNRDIIEAVGIDEEIVEQHRDECRRRAAAREEKKAEKKKVAARKKAHKTLMAMMKEDPEALAAAIEALQSV